MAQPDRTQHGSELGVGGHENAQRVWRALPHLLEQLRLVVVHDEHAQPVVAARPCASRRSLGLGLRRAAALSRAGSSFCGSALLVRVPAGGPSVK
jgi:hypothetical protein